MTRCRRDLLIDCAVLFIAFSWLLAPYYKHKFTTQWPSIEATFVADAHFLAEHWPHPRWQPLWYTGTRFDYVYPPALRYGTAALSKVFGWLPVKAYHFYTIFFYCLGIPGVYLLVRAAGRSRASGYLAALAAGLISPSLLLFKNMRDDAGPWRIPIRFGVLVRYGEGPHITAFCLLPIALAFAWRALEGKRPWSTALAGIFCAAVVSNNFYGATALAIFYPLLLWSFFLTRGERRMLFPALAIPAIAYGLTAFWLVPSYLKVTLHNMQYVSENPNSWSTAVAAGFVAAFVFFTYRWAHGRKQATWTLFVLSSLAFYTLNVVGNHFWNFRVMGEPGRLIPELDLVIILAFLLGVEWLWRRPGPWWKIPAAVFVILVFVSARHYVRHARDVIGPWPDYQARVEYRTTDWLWKNMPNSRTNSSGTVRFWFDTWHDLAELGGGSEQGLLNPVVEDAGWELALGGNAEAAHLWLKALGVDAMYLAHPNSEEPYKDGQNPERFLTMPVLYDDGKGNTLYGTERRFPSIARVVNTAQLSAAIAPPSRDDLPSLRAYVNAVENGPDSPATLEWRGTDEILVHAHFDPGQSLLLQESWDPNWQAWDGGRQLRIRQDAMGFMVVDPAAGDRTVRLEFPMPMENRVGWGITALTLAALGALAIRRGR